MGMGNGIPQVGNEVDSDVEAPKVKVIQGANDGTFSFSGVKVATVQYLLVDVFNIRDDALPFINGELVDANYALQGGDTLEFIVQDGQKGRYPGGKAKLSKQIVPQLVQHIGVGTQYREPFFGWGAIGLELIRTKQVKSIWINDKHPGVAAYWTSVIRYPKQLKQLVVNFEPSRETFYKLKEKMLSQLTQNVPQAEPDIVRLGFEKLVLHRLSYSGLGEMAGGPLSDICSRWNPKNLYKKIGADHLAFSGVNIHGDCCTCLDFEQMFCGDNCLLYLDPPYFHQGPKCYPIAFTPKDHERLAGQLQQLRNPWLLSYDDCPEIRSLYGKWANIVKVPVNCSISKANLKNELLICPK